MGILRHDDGTIDAPIGRDPKDRQSMTVVDNGKHAVTHFHVIERFKDFTFVECRLETGRTHQIRVHMKYIGFPLAGDPKYGPRKTLDIRWTSTACCDSWIYTSEYRRIFRV